MRRQTTINIFIVCIAGLFLAGCSSNLDDKNPEAIKLDSSILIPTATLNIVDEQLPTSTLPAIALTETPESVLNPTPTESVKLRTELSATDPAEIKLISGQIQVFEFFAFW